jgi:hypothetical protein
MALQSSRSCWGTLRQIFREASTAELKQTSFKRSFLRGTLGREPRLLCKPRFML